MKDKYIHFQWMIEQEKKFEKIDIGYVYVVEDCERGICKIGNGKDKKTRPQRVICDSGLIEYTIYVSEKCVNKAMAEKQVHKHFCEHRKKGEWFYVKKDDVINYIENNLKLITAGNEDYYLKKLQTQGKIIEFLHVYRHPIYYTKKEVLLNIENVKKIYEESKREDWIFK